MKRILLAILLLVPSSAYADGCSASLGNSFTPAQEKILCEQLATIQSGAAVANYEAVAGAGTVTGDAAALSATKYIHQITGANGTVGWKLPTVAAAKENQVHILLNTTAGVAKLWPETGGTINGGAADASFSALTGIKPIICVVTAAKTWICA
jgi:hypothetical protein